MAGTTRKRSIDLVEPPVDPGAAKKSKTRGPPAHNKTPRVQSSDTSGDSDSDESSSTASSSVAYDTNEIEVEEGADSELGEDADSSDESTSSSDGSDEESSEDDGSSEDVINLPRPQNKPQMTAPETQSLRSRLSTFLEAMRDANEELEADRAAGRLEDRNIENVDDEGGGYIEMDLGLGVLEEQDPEAGSSASSDTYDDETATAERDSRATGVMDRLLGREDMGKPHIEEVPDE